MSNPAVSNGETRGLFRACPGRAWRNCFSGACRAGRPGFTLLEVVGVVAILAILASLLTPAVIQSIDQAARTHDSSQLKTIADALQSAICRQGQIPASPGIPGLIAQEMGVAPSQVITNSRNVQRLFILDPKLTLGYGLPFYQTNYPGGLTNTLPRHNLRVLIISSLSDVPLPSSFNFDTAWGTPDGSVPSDWLPSWTGKGDDLTIERADLTPLFHHVILNNIGGGNSPYFSIESGGIPCATQAVWPIPPGPVDSWFLDKTVLCLYNASLLQYKAILRDDASYVFENSSWLGTLK